MPVNTDNHTPETPGAAPHPPLPLFSDGLPVCSGDDCPHYDGKRCELLGHRPDTLCSPTVKEWGETAADAVEAAGEVDALRTRLAEVEGLLDCRAGRLLRSLISTHALADLLNLPLDDKDGGDHD